MQDKLLIFTKVRQNFVGASVTALSALLVATPFWMAQAAPQKVTQPTIDAKGQQVTAALNKVLHDKVSSPGGKLQLQVQPTTRAGEGYFSEVYIAAHPAKIKKMRMTDLALRARNVHVDVPYLLKTGKVTTLASTTTLRAVVTEADLDDLLAHGKSTASMHLKVKYLGGDRVQVAGDWNWSLLSGPVVGVGRLRLAPGYKVNVDVLSLKLNGAELPGFIKNKFSQKLNPLIDYNDVPFQPRFKGIKVQGDKAILFA